MVGFDVVEVIEVAVTLVCTTRHNQHGRLGNNLAPRVPLSRFPETATSSRSTG